MGCATGDPEIRERENALPVAALSDEEVAVLQANGETLVFQHVQVLPDFGSDGGSTVAQFGTLTNDDFQRYARPFAFTEESTRYHFAAWDMPAEGGGRKKGTRVTTTDPGAALITTPVEPATIDEKLTQELASGDSEVRVLIRIRDFPDWDVPLVPSPALVGLGEFLR